MINELKRLTEAVRQSGADIAPTYAEYIQLAFAIATDCGEAGRMYFHQLCELCPKYQREHADKLFTNVLRDTRGDVHLSSAFRLASQAGVQVKDYHPSLGERVNGERVPHTHAHTREEKNTPSSGKRSGSDPIQPLPCFPDHDWPELICTILSFAKTRPQRDALLLGTLTVLGASLERHALCPYDGLMKAPCLQTFIVAPPASGKGILSLLRLIVLPIHREMRSCYEKELAQYRNEKAAYDTMGKEKAKMEVPQKPRNRMFLIAGNNSGTGILQNLMDAHGTGLIFETEADTLSTALNSDFGHWSDTLRKGFDHDMLTFNRRQDDEYREELKSYLSVLLSGTPAQVKPLIPSAENGLFSRQVFYYMPGIREWQDHFDPDDRDFEPVFHALGREWKKRLDALKQNGIHTVRLSTEQKAKFNTVFATLFRRAGVANENEMNSSIARLLINLLRMLTVVAILRGDIRPGRDVPADNIKDGIIQQWDVPVSDNDFEAVLSLADPLYRHAAHILSFLPETKVTRRENADWDSFLDALPEVFTKQQFTEQVKEWEINPNTAESWLKRAVKNGVIAHTDTRAEYRKL